MLSVNNLVENSPLLIKGKFVMSLLSIVCPYDFSVTDTVKFHNLFTTYSKKSFLSNRFLKNGSIFENLDVNYRDKIHFKFVGFLSPGRHRILR